MNYIPPIMADFLSNSMILFLAWSKDCFVPKKQKKEKEINRQKNQERN